MADARPPRGTGPPSDAAAQRPLAPANGEHAGDAVAPLGHGVSERRRFGGDRGQQDAAVAEAVQRRAALGR